MPNYAMASLSLHHIAQPICVALALFVGLAESVRAAEPTYKGRTTTSWLQDFAYGRTPDMQKDRQAAEAIRAIGKDALPLLIDRLRISSEPLTDDEIYSTQDFHTLSAFRALGADAIPAIPELIELMDAAHKAAGFSNAEPIERLTHRKIAFTALALKAMGEKAAGPLVEALASERRERRFGAAMALEPFEEQSQVVVPALIQVLSDKDEDVRWRAARSLGELHALPEQTVPALARSLREDYAANVRCYVISALEKFGSDADSALPDLRKATNDPDSVVRDYARKALKTITTKRQP
jgi:hypothetical protein